MAADWDLYRTFAAVAREGSFTGAARALQSTQPTVGRQIEALEGLLGTTLFVRSTRGLTLTAAAEQLLPHAEAMEVAAAALGRASSGEAAGASGTVRLTAPEHTGVEVLAPILADFAVAQPAIRVEVSLSIRSEDLLHREADVALRGVRPAQQSLIARRLGVASVGMFAHHRYVAAMGLPKNLSDLARHRLIGPDRDLQLLPRSVGGNRVLLPEDFFFRTDSAPMQIAAMRAGLGIAACQVNVARREPDLVQVLPDSLKFEREFWVAMHESAKTVRRVRLLFDHVAVAVAAYLRD